MLTIRSHCRGSSYAAGTFITQVCQRVEGVCYDLEYNVQAVQKMVDINQFSHINSLLAKAVELKGKLSKVSQQDSISSQSSTDGRVPPSPQTTPTTSTLSHTQFSQYSIQASAPSSGSVDDELKPKQFD